MDRLKSITIHIDKKEYTIQRSNLYEWFKLDELNSKILRAAEQGNVVEASKFIYKYLSAACKFEFKWEELAWHEISSLFLAIQKLNEIQLDLAIFKSKSKEKKLSWDYPDRDWYSLIHTLSSAYGWSVQEISDLDPEDALALVQEVFVSDQLEKEWQYQLSTVAYPLNPTTKKLEFKPLTRPDWMLPVAPDKLPVVRLPKSVLPVGLVINLSDEKYKQ